MTYNKNSHLSSIITVTALNVIAQLKLITFRIIIIASYVFQKV